MRLAPPHPIASRGGLPRSVDAIVAFCLLVVASPLMLAVSAAVALTSRGPVFFRQPRVGRGGSSFTLIKFRTMYVTNAGPAVTARGDARVTTIGRFLRKTKLDELPELWNILRGDMSLVGPRPEVPRYVDLSAALWQEALSVRPGLTDPVTLMLRNEEELLASVADREAFYLERLQPFKLRGYCQYLRARTWLSDLLVLWRTVCGILQPRRFPPSHVADLLQAAESGSPSRPGPARKESRRPPLEGQHDPRLPRMLKRFLSQRRGLLLAYHLGLVALANHAAFWLRFDGHVPGSVRATQIAMLPALLLVRAATFAPWRLYDGFWRYTGVSDLRDIIGSVGASSVAFFLLVQYVLGLTAYPRSVVMIDAILLIFLMGGIRMIGRLHWDRSRASQTCRVLVFGAGDAGAMIVREMTDGDGSYEPVGFIDDDPTKRGRRIHGVAVLGTRAELGAILAAARPDEVLVAIPTADAGTMQSLIGSLEPFRVPIKTLPSLRELLECKVTVSQIRDVLIEDLLSRPPIGLDSERIQGLIAGRRVMVTGAGGSIGSELCRQIAALGPQVLVLYERYENGLYGVLNDLHDAGRRHIAVGVIGDVTDHQRLNEVMSEHRPEIVFHAAAHKHVPLMELNPCEAVKNNVIGTKMVAEAAERFGVGRFIMISTDKAVNPSSTMGTTKRVAELIVQAMSTGGTSFVTVRFGNVLGSNGSVVPRFLSQIRRGGPVTITHPEIRRYFMLIPEAVQLVLHAAALPRPGAIYVLEMGEPIRLVDMARNLIRMSGFAPDAEIPIEFVGLRPGEKLYEELVGPDEIVEQSTVDHIIQVRPTTMPEPAAIFNEVAELERLARLGDTPAVLRKLCDIVPTFTPDESTLVASIA